MKKFQFFSHVYAHMCEMLTIVNFLCKLLLHHKTLLLSNIVEDKGFPRNSEQNFYLSTIDGDLSARADGMVHRGTLGTEKEAGIKTGVYLVFQGTT